MALFVVGMVGSAQGAAKQSKVEKRLEEMAEKMVSDRDVTELINQARENGERVTPNQARLILKRSSAMVQIRLALIAQGMYSNQLY